MFYIGLNGGWEVRDIRVPPLPGMFVVSCYQTVEETATADCFYRAGDDLELEHVAMDERDVEI